MKKVNTKMVNDSLNIIDAVFATRALQKIVAGITGFLGWSLVGMSFVIVSIKPEDIQPIAKS